MSPLSPFWCYILWAAERKDALETLDVMDEFLQNYELNHFHFAILVIWQKSLEYVATSFLAS